MNFDQLKDKALGLPLSPGVYIMKDKCDRIIYIGKAKKLKNRVSQYFQDTASHSPKTKLMVSKIDHFDVIIAASEFEALILECSLIKKHQPKYNILLKDDKGYPYLRLDTKKDYPTLEMVSRISDDGCEYFGPFGSRGVTNHLLQTLRLILQLPHCSKHLPRDIGKGRVCLHFHMGQCLGWCQGDSLMSEYRSRMENARKLLQGHYREVSDSIRKQMSAAAEELQFELAASLRDQLAAVENLGRKQLVTTDSFADTDVIGFAQNEAKACFTVLHYSNGTLLDKDYEIITLTDDPQATVSTLVKQYYFSRGMAPKIVFLPFVLDDAELLSQLLQQQCGRMSRFRVPQRGDGAHLVALANKNALEEVSRVSNREERLKGAVLSLAKMLNLSCADRIEAFDISNLSGTDIVAGMVVFQDGRPKKSAYKKFKLRGLEIQDDYGSMQQVLQRRFSHYLQEDAGFDEKPDLLLIDGGEQHAKIVCSALAELGLSFPVFGMVKDDRHRTRALVTEDGAEIRIDNNQAVFALIGNIQEETHRFAVAYHRNLRSKRLYHSALDSIGGIGPARKQQLLKSFGSIAAISAASLPELERILPKNAAFAVYDYFKNKRGDEEICE